MNSEKRREIQKRYREKNKEKIKEINKQYQKNNPDKIKEISKRYSLKHREEIRQRSALYKENNPDKIKAYRKKQFRYKDKRIILDKNPRDGKCFYCGNTERKTNLHHFEYDDNDPLKWTIEVCVICHKNLHLKAK